MRLTDIATCPECGGDPIKPYHYQEDGYEEYIVCVNDHVYSVDRHSGENI